MKKITILIPIFNEVNTLRLILEKIDEVSFCGLEKEIILIDDYSTDGTRDILAELSQTCPDKYKIFYHDKNMGKGAALRTGFGHVTGDIVIIQDADLEYNPEDYVPLIQLLVDGKADVAYGSRFLNKESEFMLLSKLANQFLTFVTNVLYNVRLTDMETCYKAFKTEFIKGIEIKSNRFDFEPEITAKVLKKGAKLIELPVLYNAREYDEGKKITWKDGVHAVWTLVKFRFSD